MLSKQETIRKQPSQDQKLVLCIFFCGLAMARPKLQTLLPVKFYRIIDHSVLHHNKLRLPDEFVQKYGGELSDVVRINVPVGGIWLIGVERTNKTLWLQEGWQNFMDHHSIDFGHFLVFNYKRNSKFDVNIFDISATEIEYAFAASSSMMPNHHTSHDNAEDDQMEGGNITVSPTNPSFKVTMKPHNVERSFSVHMRAEFVRKNLSKETDHVVLQDSEGRKWPVSVLKKDNRPAFLSKGWYAFAKANKLVIGDVCVFELIQGNGVLLKVSVFPAKNRHAR